MVEMSIIFCSSDKEVGLLVSFLDVPDQSIGNLSSMLALDCCSRILYEII